MAVRRFGEEDESILKRVVAFVASNKRKGRLAKPLQVIYDIDQLLLEVNSGASFEQYFRWASIAEIRRVVPALQLVGLDDIADVTEKAIKAAFPNGIPASHKEKSLVTGWSKPQERKLSALFLELEKENARIISVLAQYARQTGAATDAPSADPNSSSRSIASLPDPDRELYDALEMREPKVPCKEVACQGGAVVGGVLCKQHHFEMLLSRPCPFVK